MATDVTEQAADVPAAEALQPEQTPKSTGSRNLILVGGLIAFVMIAEAAVFYFLGIGSSRAGPDEKGSAAGQAAVSEEEEVQEEFAEVEIDTFSVTNTRAAADVVVHISFKLTAVVAKGQEIEFDQAANKTHKARVRQAVVEVARRATLEDLNDPSLSTFRRLIREKINKVLRRSYVVEAVISDFKTIEQ
ncbi:MAG TPA: flagellar basal body-associated FliL family protein [Planctomycetaceae bacterium]|nr:flagellar basal body-associated FliL family protein [Planctomycetaceae bacterium]